MSKLTRVGLCGKNSKGDKWTIVRYNNNKDLDIEFEDGVIVKTKFTALEAGNPMHPTKGRHKAGNKYSCADGDVVEIIEYVDSMNVICKWLSDGATSKTSIARLKEGVNKHPTKGFIKVGEIYKTNQCGDVKVLSYVANDRIIVKFQDGNEIETSAQRLKKGSVMNPSIYSGRIGGVHKTNSGWGLTVVKMLDDSWYKVKWQDGSSTVEKWADIVKGSIKPPNQKSLCGVGYFGIGKYVNRLTKPKTDQVQVSQVVYQYWQRMISRCYDPYELNKISGKNYRDVFVCKEWHNLQNFAEWAEGKLNIGKVESNSRVYAIDKDILYPKNKIYTPEYCIFVPNSINAFFTTTKNSLGYSGVNEIDTRNKSVNSKIGYVTRCTNPITNERVYGGFFSTPKAAEDKYFQMKNDFAKLLADKWDGEGLDQSVIDILRTRDMREYYY